MQKVNGKYVKNKRSSLLPKSKQSSSYKKTISKVGVERTPIKQGTEAQITDDMIRQALPESFLKKSKKNIFDDIRKELCGHPLSEIYIDNFMSAGVAVKNTHAWTIHKYCKAVKFLTHKFLGRTDLDAWICAFPEKYEELLENKKHLRFYESYANYFARSDVVHDIIETMIKPPHVAHYHLYHESIVMLGKKMRESSSDRIVIDAAIALANILAPPPDSNVNINVNVSNPELESLKAGLSDLAKQQIDMIKNKEISVKDVALMKVNVVSEQ